MKTNLLKKIKIERTISKLDFRLLAIITRQIYNPRPFTLEEVFKTYNEDDLDNITPCNAHKKTIERALKYLVGEELIEMITYKTWYSKYGMSKSDKRIKEPAGKENLYNITPKGILTYELTLISPVLSLGFMGGDSSSSDFFIKWGVLNKNFRLQWSRHFFYHNPELIFFEYQQKTIADLEEYFAKKITPTYDLELNDFFELISAQTLLKTEAIILKMISISQDEVIEKIKRGKDFYPEVPDNRIIAAKTNSLFLKTITKEFLVPLWKESGGKGSILKDDDHIFFNIV